MCKVSTGNDEGAVRIFELGKKLRKCQCFAQMRANGARIPETNWAGKSGNWVKNRVNARILPNRESMQPESREELSRQVRKLGKKLRKCQNFAQMQANGA